MTTSLEEQKAHLDSGTCRCHDSYDQCPCAEDGHPADGSCDCCPLGTGLCGPRPTRPVMENTVIELINLCPNGQPSLMERMLARQNALSGGNVPSMGASYIAGQQQAWDEARRLVAHWAAEMEMRR